MRSAALDLFSNSLPNCHRYVALDGAKYSSEDVKNRLMIGSILGRVFVLGIINDIRHIPLAPDIVIYAEDTNVVFSWLSVGVGFIFCTLLFRRIITMAYVEYTMTQYYVN